MTKSCIVLIIIVFVAKAIFSQTPTPCPGNYNSHVINAQPVNNPEYKPGWHFIHQEEFDGASDIDNLFWDKWHGNWQNGAFFLPENITVSNGRCNLNVNYAPDNYTWGDTHYFTHTSAYMLTKKEYGPGYFWEMKGKRNEVGFKSSFWSFNYTDDNGMGVQPTDPEYREGLSVFDNGYESSNDLNKIWTEVIGPNNQNSGCSEYTYFNYPGAPYYQCCMPLPNTVDETYSLDFQSSEVKMYVNNKLIIRNTTKVPQSTQSFGFWATTNYWNPTLYPYNGKMEMDYVRMYKKNEEVSTPYSNYCVNQGYTNQDLRPRFIADFNADGKKDVIAFGYQNVKASLGDASNRDIAILPYNDVILNEYTVEQGWNTQQKRPRLVGDINGDGKADIVGFGIGNTLVSLSNSTSAISFLPIQNLGAGYTVEQGWVDQNENQRLLSDVNGDGKDDIIGFSNSSVYVSLSNSSLSTAAFYPYQQAIVNFTKSQGWINQNIRPRFLADINGDGKKDIIGFGYNSVYVSFSNCTSNLVSFSTPVVAFNDFTVEQGYSSQDVRPRFLADINGDGKDDIIGCGNNNMYASISNCIGNSASFISPTYIGNHFTVEQGFMNSNTNPRFVYDINNDKKADIIGFNNNMIQIATSKSTGNSASFHPYNNFIDDFTNLKGWSTNSIYPRTFSDLNGDGSLDLIGFGINDITTSQSIGGTYNIPFTVLSSNKTTSNDWTLRGSPNGRDAHFKFYLRYPTDVTVTSCFPETDFWEILSIRGMDGSNKANVNVGEFNTNCQMTVSLPEGYYYVVVDGYAGETGNFKLQVNGVEHPQRIGHFSKDKEEIKQGSFDFSIYPNPNDGTFTINIAQNQLFAAIEIIDAFGKVFYNGKISAIETVLNTELESGVYFVKVTDLNGLSSVKKVVIGK